MELLLELAIRPIGMLLFPALLTLPGRPSVCLPRKLTRPTAVCCCRYSCVAQQRLTPQLSRADGHNTKEPRRSLRSANTRGSSSSCRQPPATFCVSAEPLTPLKTETGPPSMADVFAELKRLWKDLCRESGVIFNFLLGQGGDTLFAGEAAGLCSGIRDGW